MNSVATPTFVDISSHLTWFKSYAAEKTAQEKGDTSPMNLKLTFTKRAGKRPPYR